MITIEQYFIGRHHSPDQEESAADLLFRVNSLLYEYQVKTGHELHVNVHTDNLISGLTEGGFRLPECTQGAANSSHKQAMGVDIYDQDNKLDGWVTDDILTENNLYREHPDSTDGWCHLTTRPPHSGHRTFLP
jgi:hypothetical protein